MNRKQQFKEGLITNNPVLVQQIGMCATMAITTTLFNGVGMGLSVLIILTCCNVVVAAIRKIIPDEIRLAMLADIAGMSTSAFSRFFKLHTGRNLTDYIIDIRLGAAARMLVDTKRSISEICFNCGFNNLSNFNRIFKKKKGCSPTEFRDNYRKTRIII